MNGRVQIYVNYFLIVFEMKKIILLFFTFLGICSCFSQELPENKDSTIVSQRKIANTLPLKPDSVKTKEKALVRIFPNPAKNKIEIEIKGFTQGYVKLQLLTNTGKLVREEKRLVLNGNETIIFMFSEIPGLYYLLLKQGTQMLKSKLIIQ